MKSPVPFFLLVIVLFISQSCTVYQKDYEDKADELAHELIIVDGHVGLPHELLRKNEQDDSYHNDFSYDKAQDGGLNAAFMVINASTLAKADSLIGAVRQLATDQSDHYGVATSPDQIQKQFKNKLISLPMGLAGIAPLEHKVENVRKFYDKGVRYINLKEPENEQMDNASSSDDNESGLSNFEKQLIKKMNHAGMMIDVSQLSDSAFTDVINTTKAPVIASNSSARYFTKNFEKNMSDKMIKKLAKNNGMMMINFHSNFISDSSRVTADSVQSHFKQWLEENDKEKSDPEAQEYLESYREQNYYYARVSDVADHIDHIANLAGIDYVGIGSGFNGDQETLPRDLNDVSTYPNLIQELLKRGYTKDDIRKICYKNIFRVWHEVQARAEELSSQQEMNP